MSGYDVWVDLRSLKGGQDFWDEIENELRHRVIKQIVLISPHIRKPGVKKELALGDAMGRHLNDPNFMIPIRVKPVPHSDFPPELLRRNAIEAQPSWSACLPLLLETLQDARVPRLSSVRADLIANIVAAQETARQSIVPSAEELVSNWFDLSPGRPNLRMFGSKGTPSQLDAWLGTVHLPYIRHSGLVATFCDPKTFAAARGGGPTLIERFNLPFDSLVRGRDDTPFVNRADARRNITNLVRQHWDLALERRGLKRFEFAAGKTGWYFPDGLVSGAVVADLDDGLHVDRVLTGKFKERRWHLCLVARSRLWPDPLIRVHANIALTEEGRVLPGEATHGLRRRLTRSWWNNKWRDVLLASMYWLAEGQPVLSIAAGTETFGVSALPRRVEIPVSYQANETRASEENAVGEIDLSPELDDGCRQRAAPARRGGQRHMSLEAIYIGEPLLRFAHGQSLEAPKDGLFLFGPVEDSSGRSQVRLGIIGTPEGVGLAQLWMKRLSAFIPGKIDKNGGPIS